MADSFGLSVTPPASAQADLKVGFRPDDFVAGPAPGLVEIEAEVENAEFSGSGFLARCRIGAAVFQAFLPEKPSGSQRKRLFLDPARLHFFDPTTGKRII